MHPMVIDIIVVQRCISHLESQLSLTSHRITSINREVQKYIFKLSRINKAIPEARSDDSFNLYRFSEGSAKHIIHVAKDAAGIDWFWLKRLLATES